MLRLRSREQGFTLIELLTVIAIIAILAAIIFPAMQGVQKKAQQTKCMSNMMSISKAIKMYKLDNRKYPDSLAVRAVGLTGKFDDYIGTPTKGALMGDYGMKSAAAFRCPASKTTDYGLTTPSVLDPTGAVIGGNSPMQYFAVDDYDIYQESGDWKQKYVTAWATQDQNGAYNFNGLAPDPIAGNNADEEDYKRQLQWRDPSDDTVVTWCTNHSNGTKDAVLFLDGTCRLIDHATVAASKWRTRMPRI